MKYPLSFVVSNVRPVIQRYESRTVQKAPLIKVTAMKNTDISIVKGKPLCATAKLAPFAVSQDEWDYKGRNWLVHV